MRRSLSRLQAEEESAIDLTPMLDVVFIMLIFFIVTASFVKESGIEVNKPEASTASKQDRANILIAISGNDEIWIEGRRTDYRALRAVIERMHSENPQGTVVIQADEKSTNDKLVKVMDAARQAGVTNISMATNNR